MSFIVVKHTLAADVANAGTFTIGYPTGTNNGTFQGGTDHQVVSNTYGVLKATESKVAFTFGTDTTITIQNLSGATMLAGTEVHIQLDKPDGEAALLADPLLMGFTNLVQINLGAPDAADPDGICESQSIGEAGELDMDGDLVGLDGVAVLDVPRGLVVDSGGADTAVITITGTDAYGEVLVENIQLDGMNAVPGKKAFKTVTKVEAGGAISNGAFVGTTDVLGLPVFLPGAGYVLSELEGGAKASAGTLAAGVSTTATATTGDVRGTYDPNSAADGEKSFSLIVALPDPDYKGVPQYDG